MRKLKNYVGEFPGGLVVRILCFHCRGPGSVPGLGTEIPASCAARPKKQTDCVTVVLSCLNLLGEPPVVFSLYVVSLNYESFAL